VPRKRNEPLLESTAARQDASWSDGEVRIGSIPERDPPRLPWGDGADGVRLDWGRDHFGGENNERLRIEAK
jgi:hypothetical protein